MKNSLLSVLVIYCIYALAISCGNGERSKSKNKMLLNIDSLRQATYQKYLSIPKWLNPDETKGDYLEILNNLKTIEQYTTDEESKLKLKISTAKCNYFLGNYDYAEKILDSLIDEANETETLLLYKGALEYLRNDTVVANKHFKQVYESLSKKDLNPSNCFDFVLTAKLANIDSVIDCKSDFVNNHARNLIENRSKKELIKTFFFESLAF